MSPKEICREEQERIYTVKTYVLEHLKEAFTIRQLSRKAAMGEQRFKEEFSRLFGMPVGTYIHATRMQTGKFLLVHTTKTIKEISGLCGYRRYKSFLKAYKKFFGVSAGFERRVKK